MKHKPLYYESLSAAILKMKLIAIIALLGLAVLSPSISNAQCSYCNKDQTNGCQRCVDVPSTNAALTEANATLQAAQQVLAGTPISDPGYQDAFDAFTSANNAANDAHTAYQDALGLTCMCTNDEEPQDTAQDIP